MAREVPFSLAFTFTFKFAASKGQERASIMLHTLFGTFRWMPVLGIIIGIVCGYFFWEEKQRIGLVGAEGVEAVATLIQIRQQTNSQNRKTSYWADIKWQDASGAERRAEKIPVSGTFARRVSKDRQIIQRETRIKYLPDNAEMRPLLLEDGMHNSWQTPAMMWLSFAFAVFCIYGWVHMLRYERRRSGTPKHLREHKV